MVESVCGHVKTNKCILLEDWGSLSESISSLSITLLGLQANSTTCNLWQMLQTQARTANHRRLVSRIAEGPIKFCLM